MGMEGTRWDNLYVIYLVFFAFFCLVNCAFLASGCHVEIACHNESRREAGLKLPEYLLSPANQLACPK